MNSTQQTQTKMENQHNSKCEECEKVLSEDVPIMCCENEDGEEMVLCSNCWHDFEEEWREEGWTCDEDEDDE